MFWRKTTITRPDRDRLVEITRAKANTLRWAMFIDDLRRAVSRARVVQPARVPGDVVTMQSKIRLSDLTREREEVYTLVYPEDADLAQGKLSVLSPLGTALLGARVGDVVSLVTGTGPRTIKISSVLYQPETAERVGALPPNHGGSVMNRFTHPLYADARMFTLRAAYRDPVRSEEERQANAAQLAKTRAALRRAKLAERWVVYTIAAMLAVAMLPVMVAIAVVAAAVSVWRRVSLNLRRRAKVTGRDERAAEAALDQRAAVREVQAGIHLPRRRPMIDVRQRKAPPLAGELAGAWRREQAMEGV
jgi:regulator of nucleoside diphosphate kinase